MTALQEAIQAPRAALAAAERQRQAAIAENAAGRPARGARAAARGLRLLDATPADEPPAASGDPARERSVAQLLTTLAKSEFEINGLDRGLELMDRAERWAARAGDPFLLALLRSQRGLILFRGGRFAAAREEFDAAVAAIPDRAGLDKCRVLLNRGALFVEMGDVRSARTDLTRCIQLAEAAGLAQVRRIALHNLGCLEFIAGDLPLALRTIDAGIAMDGQTQQGIAFLDRARILLAAGLGQEADESLVEAAALLSRERSWQDVGEVELTRAESALLAGDAKAARRLAGRARDRFRRHGNDRWRRIAELTLLQADLRDGRPAGRLAPPAHRLVAEFDADGFELPARTARLLAAELELRSGRPEAAAALVEAAGRARRSDPIALRLHAHYVRGQLAREAGSASAARRQVRTGMAALAAYQSQFGGIDVQTASAVHGSRLAELDLELAFEQGTPGAVFAAVERGRAASQRLRVVTPPADPEVADLLAELRRLVQGLAARRADRSAADSVAADRRRVAALQRRLRARSWQVGGTGDRTRPATLTELRTALAEPDQCLVSLVEFRGGLHAVLLRSGRARLVDLGPVTELAELANRIRADLDLLARDGVPEAILRSGRHASARSLTALAGRLVDPLGLAGGRLVVIPSPGLLTLPWGLLPGLRGRPVEVAPSASSWLRAASRRPSAQGPAISVFAGPDLASAEAEVTGVGSVWIGAEVCTGTAASPAALRAALARGQLVHVAAHGEHVAESPMFSSLRLSGGPLFAYELDPATHRCEHVVLSACDLGRVTLRAGEESLGLTSALLHLGTRSVVAGVARVNDDTAAAVMVDYHRRLRAGQDSAAALAGACAETDRPAPFVAFGASWTATTTAR